MVINKTTLDRLVDFNPLTVKCRDCQKAINNIYLNIYSSCRLLCFEECLKDRFVLHCRNDIGPVFDSDLSMQIIEVYVFLSSRLLSYVSIRLPC